MKTVRGHSFLILITTLCVTTIIPVVHSKQCLQDQQSKLLHFKNNLVFDSFSDYETLISWNASTDCCSWIGITCSANGRVIGIDISAQGVSGGIGNSSSLFDFQHLQSLNLADNYFGDQAIPSAIGQLTNLRYLNLSYNFFGGQIPVEISYLKRLVVLDLSGSFQEVRNLSKIVHNLTELTELHLDSVDISGQGSEWCHTLSSSVPKLRVLSLKDCHLSGPIHESIAKLQSLAVIELSSNNFSSPVPSFFANFSNLISLSLAGCGLQGTFPEIIFQIPTLQYIDLYDNPELHGSLPEFPKSGSLQYLNLVGSMFSGSLPNTIGNLLLLSTLNLTDCSFIGSIPRSIGNLTQLVDLDLSYNNFTGRIDSIQWENLINLVTLRLDYNALSGSIPSSIFSSSLLKSAHLSNNQFTGQFPELSNTSSFLLDSLDLNENKLEGSVPVSIFNLRGLDSIDLSSNNLSVFPFYGYGQPRNVSFLNLSRNSLFINFSSSSSFLQVGSSLNLASNKLRVFPDFLRNQRSLTDLDLSDNQIHDEIPNWIWRLNLTSLNLCCNELVTLKAPSFNSTLKSLDLHSNQLQCQIPLFLPFATHLDYSRNNFSSTIPTDIGDMLTAAEVLDLSNNNLYGPIPRSVCTIKSILDLSNNSLSGKIPQCWATFLVLNLKSNNLSGTIPDQFFEDNPLQSLDLSKNHLQGRIPKSLVNCTMLSVLNLAHNQIEDTFPCMLKSISTLRVLELRSNKLYGSNIGCLQTNGSWSMLQIIDLADNNFSGQISGASLATWRPMIDIVYSPDLQRKARPADRVRVVGCSLKTTCHGYDLWLRSYNFSDIIPMIIKGLERDLSKIQPYHTIIDLSNNRFNGSIPEEMGNFKSLFSLNLSNNAFTGEIPSTFGNMGELESLDLSNNSLSGKIPPEIAQLTFLSFLNLSNNQLVGRIPTSTISSQFSTFPNTSFGGNKGLWGPPLTSYTTPPLPPAPLPKPQSVSSSEIDWNFLSVEIGFTFGFGIAIASLFFCKRWSEWYYTSMYKILVRIFPQLEQRFGRHRRHVYANPMWQR